MSTDKPKDEAIAKEAAKQASGTAPSASQAPETKPAQPMHHETQAPQSVPEALPQHLLDLLARSSLADLRGPAQDAIVQKGNALPASVLVTGPAAFEFSALAIDLLGKVGEDAGLAEKAITRFSAELIGTSKTVLIKAIPGANRTVFELTCDKSGTCSANLFKLLGPARLTVASGWRERYDVHMVPKGHPYWPGLLIDLGRHTERLKAPVKKKKAKAPKPGPENKDGTGTKPTDPTVPPAPDAKTEHESE
jgi:hypothetical protein